MEKEQLVLYTDEPRLTQGILLSSLISTAGFTFDESANKFILPKSANVNSALEYAVDLLNDENISFALDSKCSKLIANIGAHIEDLKKFIVLGDEIKKPKKSPKITPPGFTKPLLENQQQAVALHTQMPFSADFSVPGSGKTWIGYATYSIFKQKGIVRKLLIIGPISSFQPWQDEHVTIFERPANVAEIRGTAKERLKIYANYKHYEIFLISYYSFANDKTHISELLKKDDFMVILDESHNVKQPGAKRTNAALEIAPFSKRRMILSGTPIPRSIDDLYSQFSFLDPNKDVLGVLGNFNDMIEQDESLELVKNRISPFYYRIRKNDFSPRLPEPIFERQYLDMITGQVRDSRHRVIDNVTPAPHQNAIYYGIEGKIFREIQREKEMTWDELVQLQKWQKGRLMRLLEVASNPALLMNVDLEMGTKEVASTDLPIYKKIERYHKLDEIPVKVQRAIDITNKLLATSDKKKIIIWTSFILNISELKRRLQKFDPVIVHGGIPKNEDENKYFHRLAEIKKFKSDKNCRVLIANPASLAESVSLHKNEKGEPVCDTAIYLDRTFNGAHYMQSLDRIHRVGIPLNKQVRYILLLTNDTIDLDIDDSLEEKISNMKRFLNDDIRKFSLETDYDDITGGFAERQDYERVVSRLKKHAEQGKFD